MDGSDEKWSFVLYAVEVWLIEVCLLLCVCPLCSRLLAAARVRAGSYEARRVPARHRCASCLCVCVCVWRNV